MQSILNGHLGAVRWLSSQEEHCHSSRGTRFNQADQIPLTSTDTGTHVHIPIYRDVLLLLLFINNNNHKKEESSPIRMENSTTTLVTNKAINLCGIPL